VSGGRPVPNSSEPTRQINMHNGNTLPALRRSSRVPTAVQILVTSLDTTHFSEVCETLVVNAHGCAMLTRVKLDTGVPLHFHSKDGRETTAQVVTCQPTSPDHRSWILGARLDRPENFWGLKVCPKDWTLPTATVTPRHPQILKPTNTLAPNQLPGVLNQPLESAIDSAKQSEAQVRKMIAESVRPVQAEIRSLREKLAQREANPSRFEVSLSSIPPELEQQLELRLREDLGPRVLDGTRQQSAHLLASAKATIDQQTSEGCEEFMRRAAEELKVVEKRAQDISARITENTQEHLRRGLEEFHQKLLDGGNSLKRLSEDLVEFLQHNLDAEHDARREDLERLRASVASESSRLHEQVEYLDTRIAKLDESARCLESGLDQRLSRMSSDILRDTRSQFESVANEILEELTTRGVKALGDRMEEASGNMQIVQNGIVASVSESLKVQAANALQAFEHSIEELARLSVERCRLRLEGGLSALARSLNEQFPMQAKPGDDRR
jgi:hypothetical protein